MSDFAIRDYQIRAVEQTCEHFREITPTVPMFAIFSYPSLELVIIVGPVISVLFRVGPVTPVPFRHLQPVGTVFPGISTLQDITPPVSKPVSKPHESHSPAQTAQYPVNKPPRYHRQTQDITEKVTGYRRMQHPTKSLMRGSITQPRPGRRRSTNSTRTEKENERAQEN